MSNQVDPLLFWLEQEPVNSEADIYLPADTPTDCGLSKYNYQLDKRRHMKRSRAIERLKAFEFEKIENKRKTQADNNDLPMPLPPFAKLEVIKGDDFLNSHVDEIIEILQMTGSQYHQDDGKHGPQEEQILSSDLRSEERDHSYAKSLQMKSFAIVEEYEKEFARIRNNIFDETRDQSNHLAPSAIQTSDSPPLPPRVSSRDPRSFLPEFRKPH